MSRIGKKPILIAKGVKVGVNGNLIHVEGPKGKLSRAVPSQVEIVVEGEQVLVKYDAENLRNSSMQGLARTLVSNMIDGVTKGFEKNLEIVGVGYRAESKGNTLNLSLGFSHPVEFPVPDGISIEVEKQTKIKVLGADKEMVGETAATIRQYRPPEPYKGKGIRYKDERIIRKAGKTGKK